MKRTEAKRRVSLAIRALKGAPLVEDIYRPNKIGVERTDVVKIGVEHEVRLPEADMIGPESVAKMAKRGLLESLAKGLEQAGVVQIREKRTIHAIVYYATIRALLPTEED